MSDFSGDLMPQDDDGEIEIIPVKARLESKDSLVITIPKQICTNLKISEGSRLDLIVYNSFVVLRQKKRIDYLREPNQEILELMDRVFCLFEELRELERQGYTEKTIPRMKEIDRILKEAGSKILAILKEEKGSRSALSFTGEFRNTEEVLEVLRQMYVTNYKDFER